MKRTAYILPLVLAACAAAPTTNLERVALKTTANPKPSCEGGHEGALRNGVVTISPGQTICLELKVSGQLVTLAAVTTDSSQANVLVLRAWQEPEGKETFLSLHNPLGSFLRYNAHMLPRNESKAQYTSSCPVLSSRLSVEHWPYPVRAFTLQEFSVMPESDTLECK